MRGLLIKTEQRCIEPIDLPDEGLSAVYVALLINRGSRTVEAIRLDRCLVPSNDTLLVDEEGRLRRATQALGGFTIGPAFFVGRGLIIGTRGSKFSDHRILLTSLLDYIGWVPAPINGSPS